MKTPSPRPLTIPGLLSLVLLIASSYAVAADSSEPDSEAALIRKGLDLRQKGQDEAALREFRRAYDQSNGARALAQIALAEQALGRWLDAENHLSEALRRTQDVWIGRNKKHLGQALEEIQGHLGSLDLTGDGKEGKVLVNGEQVGTLPLTAPLRVLAGSVALEVQAPGYLPIFRTVLIPARSLAREPLIFVAVAPTAKATRPEPTTEQPTSDGVKPIVTKPATHTSGWGTRQTVGVIVGGVALGSLAGGFAFYLKHESDAKSYNEDASCRPKTGSAASYCDSKYNTINSDKYLMIAGFVGTAVLGGIATYLLLSSPSADADKVATRDTGLHLQCGPTPGLGVLCAGRF